MKPCVAGVRSRRHVKDCGSGEFIVLTNRNVLPAVAGILGFALSTSVACAATVVPVGPLPPSNPYFYITSGTPAASSMTANFGATIAGASKSFDDVFEFMIPQDGTGSGSLSTSFSAQSNELSISQVLIDGVAYGLTSSAAGQGLAVSGVPIRAGVLNTIEVKGVTSPTNIAATYAGTATFAAGVPEPATWTMLIGGLGLTGAMMRRRRSASGALEKAAA